MPNTLANIVLYAWPLVVLGMFALLPRARALILAILAGYLILPVKTGFDAPFLPPLDKTLIPSLAAAFGCMVFAGRRDHPRRSSQRFANAVGEPALAHRRGPVGAAVKPVMAGRGGLVFSRTALAGNAVEDRASGNVGQSVRWRRSVPHGRLKNRSDVVTNGLLVLLVLCPFATAFTNTEVVSFGHTVLPALTLHDAFSMSLAAMVQALPFVLGWRFLAAEDDHRVLLQYLVLAALAYSALALLEIRLSPQMNTWVYGFFQHSFEQHMRGDGFRPLVFLQHGLWLSIFFAMAILAAAGLWRQMRSDRLRGGEWLLALAWLLMTLGLSHSLGALLLVLIMLPWILFVSARTQIAMAAAVAVAVLALPAMRVAGFVPVDAVEQVVRAIDAERAESWRFRVDNEEQLFARAMEKPLFGWGGWNRNSVHDPDGRDVSVTDGQWVITFGVSGWAGYFAVFGLLALPILGLWRHASRWTVAPATAALCVVLACNLADLVPNATMTPLTWLVAGALAGYLGRTMPHGAEPGARNKLFVPSP